MAQLEAMRRYVKGSPNGGTSEQTVEQLLHYEDPAVTQRTTTPTASPKNHDHEDHGKKSVLTKVKEKAKKLRHSLSKKKSHGHDDVVTPTSAVMEEDDDEGDPEYYGAPMYESEKAPEDVKETAKQRPREDVVSEKHVLPSSISPRSEKDKGTSKKADIVAVAGNPSPMEALISIQPEPESVRTKRTATTVKPEPANTTKTVTASPALQEAADATKNIADSLAPIEVKNNNKADSLAPIEVKNNNKADTLPPTEVKNNNKADTLPPTEVKNNNNIDYSNNNNTKTIADSVSETLGPAYASACEATHMITSKIHDMALATSSAITRKDEMSNNEQKYDKGVSVKEYLMQKFEPGEEEKVLSEVISDAISPTKKPGDKTVVEKVRGVVSSLLASNEHTSSFPATNSPKIPVSTNAYTTYEVVEEKTEGRILQTN